MKSHDSPNTQHPLSHHAATLTIRRDPFAQSMLTMPRTGQLARSFGTINAIYPSLTISPFLVNNQVHEIVRQTNPDPCLTWRRRIERFTIGDLEDSLCRTPSTRVALLLRAALSHPDGLRRKTSIQLASMRVSKPRSGKADGVSAQHTCEVLLESREQQAVSPGHSCCTAALILNGESFASAQRQKINRECGSRPNQRFSAHVSSPLGPGQGAVYESRTCQHRSFFKTNSRIQR